MFSSSKSGTTAMIRRGSVLMPINFITPSVHRSFRFNGFCPGYSRFARLWLMITTRSAPSLSPSLKSRPAATGTPNVAKNPGDTERKFARSPAHRSAPRALRRKSKADIQPAIIAPRSAEARTPHAPRPAARPPPLHLTVELAHLLRRLVRTTSPAD